MSCPPDQELQAGLCYPKCREGYTGMGPLCWQNCPPGFNDAGFACMKTNYGRGEGAAPIQPQPITAPVVAPTSVVTAPGSQVVTALEAMKAPAGIPIWIWIIIGILALLVIILAILLFLKKCPSVPAYSVTRTVPYSASGM